MENEIMGPELDSEIEKTDAERYSDLLLEIYDICYEAQDHLHLFDTRPECARLILEDYLKKIEELSSI